MTGFGLAVEIGDWPRLIGRSIGAFGPGADPRADWVSRSQGASIKTGNTYARRPLIEAAWHQHARYRTLTSEPPQPRATAMRYPIRVYWNGPRVAQRHACRHHEVGREFNVGSLRHYFDGQQEWMTSAMRSMHERLNGRLLTRLAEIGDFGQYTAAACVRLCGSTPMSTRTHAFVEPGHDTVPGQRQTPSEPASGAAAN